MKRSLDMAELIEEIAEVLRQGDGEFVEALANQVLVPNVTYKQDGFFTQEIEESE